LLAKSFSYNNYQSTFQATILLP